MLKCYNKPNRSEKRVFHAADAARIARYASEIDGVPVVGAKVLGELGLRDSFCRVLSIVGALDRLEDALGLSKILGALATIVGGIIKVIKATGPLAKRFGYALIALGTLQLFLKGLAELLDELEAVRQARELAQQLCNDAPSAEGEFGDVRVPDSRRSRLSPRSPSPESGQSCSDCP